MVESADTSDLKSDGSNTIRVQVPSFAPNYAPEAQLVEAYVLYTEGCGFKSHGEYHYGCNSSMVEPIIVYCRDESSNLSATFIYTVNKLFKLKGLKPYE